MTSNYGQEQEQYYKLPQPVSFMRYPNQSGSQNTQLPPRNINESNQHVYQYHHINQVNSQANFMPSYYQSNHSVPMIYLADYPNVVPQPR